MSTSVQCSVCSAAIKEGNEKIYCFGPCGKIMHPKCCGEINMDGIKAMQTNRGLKYFCHDCRNSQCDYNNVLGICNSILTKVNETEKMMKKEITEQIREYTKTANEANEKGFVLLKDYIMSENKKLEDKLSAKTNTSGRNRKEETSLSGPSGNTRSQSKQKTAKAGETVSVTQNYAEVLINGRKESEIDQNREIPKEKETVIIIKPKEGDQSAKKTKQQLKEKLNRTENHILNVREGRNGTVILGVLDNVESVAKSVQEKCGELFNVTVPKPKKPRLKIVKVAEELNEKELREALIEQNDVSDDIELRLVTSFKNGLDEYCVWTYIIEVDSSSHEFLLELEKVNIGWERCKIVECFGIIRCFKCCCYGHKSNECKSDREVCSICAENHRTNECKSEIECCANCSTMNRMRGLKLSTDHVAFSRECPVYKRQVARKRHQIDYTR